MSRRERNIGAVPVFGFTLAKSAAVIANARSGSDSSSVDCRKKPQSAASNVRAGLAIIDANLNRESTSSGRCPSRVPSTVQLSTRNLRLCVAITTFVSYNYLVSRVDGFVLDMERSATDLLNILAEKRDENAV